MGFPLWVIGVLLSALASFCGTVGLSLQKLAHQKQALRKENSQQTLGDTSSQAGKSKAKDLGKITEALEEVDEEEEEESESSSTSDSDEDASKGSKSRKNRRSSNKPQRARTTPTAGPDGHVVMTLPGAGESIDDSGDEEWDDMDDDEEEEEQEEGQYWTDPVWLLGMGMVILGALLDVVTFGFAPQSLLAPMASLTLVFNTLVAPRFLGETLSRRDVFATFIIICGTAIVVVFSPHETPEYTISVLRDLYLRLIVFAYAGAVGGAIFLLLGIIKRYGEEESPQPEGIMVFLYPFSFPALAGTVGGQSILFSKISVELLKTTIQGDNQFFAPEPYVCIVMLALTLFLQVKFLNGGLARFDALYVIPVYQVFWMISGILGGAIFFDEFSTFNTAQWIAFPLGTCVTMFGIFLLTQRDNKLVQAVDGLVDPDHKDEGLSTSATENVLAMSVHRASVFFGARNSVFAAMGTVTKPLNFAVPNLPENRRRYTRRFSRSMHNLYQNRRRSFSHGHRSKKKPKGPRKNKSGTDLEVANEAPTRRYTEFIDGRTGSQPGSARSSLELGTSPLPSSKPVRQANEV